ncbi:hypothetical protein FKM82_000453 [Ascaphus truei]
MCLSVSRNNMRFMECIGESPHGLPRIECFFEREHCSLLGLQTCYVCTIFSSALYCPDILPMYELIVMSISEHGTAMSGVIHE